MVGRGPRHAAAKALCRRGKAREATRLAEEALDEWDYDDEPDSFASAVQVKSVADLPGAWDLGCIPWGRKDAANPDKTIGELLEEAKR